MRHAGATRTCSGESAHHRHDSEHVSGVTVRWSWPCGDMLAISPEDAAEVREDAAKRSASHDDNDADDIGSGHGTHQ